MNTNQIDAVLRDIGVHDTADSKIKSVKKSKTPEEQLAEQEFIVAGLREEIKANNAEKEKRRKENEALIKKQKITNDLMGVLKAYGLDVGSVSPDFEKEAIPETKKAFTAKTESTLVSEDAEIRTNKGLWFKIGVFAFFMFAFAIYQNFATLNDSQSRILDAAETHLWTHLWLALGTILFGFAIQYAVFNKQFRYFSNNIESAHSWSSDFDNPTFQGTVRMSTTFLTWLVPTWICGNVMLLILG